MRQRAAAAQTFRPGRLTEAAWSEHGFLTSYLKGDALVPSPQTLPIIVEPDSSHSLDGRAKLWSAAACCRFPPRELGRGFSNAHPMSVPQVGLEKGGRRQAE
jgi:hypothetical protein